MDTILSKELARLDALRASSDAHFRNILKRKAPPEAFSRFSELEDKYPDMMLLYSDEANAYTKERVVKMVESLPAEERAVITAKNEAVKAWRKVSDARVGRIKKFADIYLRMLGRYIERQGMRVTDTFLAGTMGKIAINPSTVAMHLKSICCAMNWRPISRDKATGTTVVGPAQSKLPWTTESY